MGKTSAASLQAGNFMKATDLRCPGLGLSASFKKFTAIIIIGKWHCPHNEIFFLLLSNQFLSNRSITNGTKLTVLIVSFRVMALQPWENMAVVPLEQPLMRRCLSPITNTKECPHVVRID